MTPFLHRLRRRARLVAAREGFLDAFFWTSYAAACLLLADRIRMEMEPGGRALSDAKGILVLLGGALVLSIAGAVARALATRPEATDLARAADRKLGLEDRVATATEGARGLFGAAVEREAAASVAGVSAGRVFPSPRVGTRAWSVAALLVALLLLLVPLPEARRAAAEAARRSGGAGEGEGKGEGKRSSGGGKGTSAGGGEKTEPGEESGGGGQEPQPKGRPAPPPPLFGDPEREKFTERPEQVQPLVGEGDWKPAGSQVDPGAAAAGAPEAATEAERLTVYRKQAEAFVGKDGFTEADRELVKKYFERIAPK